MRTHDNPTQGNKSLKLVVWFLLALFVVLGISLGIKAVVMIRESSFDGQHRFTVFLKDDHEHSAVISLEPQGKTVVLRLLGKPTDKQAESALLLPFDGVLSGSHEMHSDDSLQKLIGSFLFSPGSVYNGLTKYDLLRLYLLAFKDEKDITYKSETVAKGKVASDTTRKLFNDAGIMSDDKTIAIMNSTDVSGLGTRLEQVFVTLGGQVVSVTSGRDLQEPTHIFYSGKKSYTVERIERIFHQQAEEGNTDAADVLVVIGKRSLPLGFFATLQL